VTAPPASIKRPESPKLFLVDGYALIYRAFFALISRPLTTKHGENTSAAWGIVNFLQRLTTTHKPDYLGWVHDSGLSFRHEKYPAYKATREKLTAELQSDFDRGMERICQILEASHIPILTLKGYEADDVIGTLARQGAESGVNVIVVSGDKDFQQLVRPGVWLLNPGRGGPASVEESWVSVENGSERLGVSPGHVVDYLALVGDTSDNVPGVKGVGEKTAQELVASFGTLENILANAHTLTKKRPREALETYRAEALLSKELVTIRDDLPITLDLESLRIQPPDVDTLRGLYVELEFNNLAKALGRGEGAVAAPAAATASTLVPERAEAPGTRNYTTAESVADVERLVAEARKAGRLGLDVEFARDPGVPDYVDPLRSHIVGISVSIAAGEAVYIPLGHRERQPEQGSLGLLGAAEPAPRKRAARTVTPASIAARALAEATPEIRNLPELEDPRMSPLRALLEDESVRKCVHNAKFAMLALRRIGVTLRGVDFDPMIASYVLDPGRRSHNLDLLAMEFLDRTLTSFEDLCGKGKDLIPLEEAPTSCVRDYSGEIADTALQLYEVFQPQLEGLELSSLYETIELPLAGVLAEMQWHGVSIDRQWFAALKERFAKERERVEREIYAIAGEEFNINSNLKLREILFERLGLPVLKKTATGPSTDVTVLQQLADEGHQLPVLLMDYREVSKLESTYIDSLPALVNPRTGRLHSNFNQTVAATGRLSSSDPNLQNIPIRRELGRDIRRGFVPAEGHVFLAADYSQIELRLLAHLSNDPSFVEAFRAGGDIHRQTAALIFEVPLAEVTSDMRARAKTINFATIYGQGPHALSKQLKIAHADAKSFIERYFERFASVRAYLDSMVEHARTHGYVTTLFGRRRYIPEIRDRNFNMRAFGERTAANSPIQGSAADLIKIAMIRIDAALRESGARSKMLLQVHDELVFEVPHDETVMMRELVRQQMEHAAELSVPLVVDMGVGNNWLSTKAD
jgi:DNA polymerase-1